MSSSSSSTSSSKSQLATLQKEKLALEEELKTIEKQIYDLEESYIDETAHYGNVIKGWEGYLSSKAKPAYSAGRKVKISDKDRLFSQSSVTAPQSVDDDMDSDADDLGSNVGIITSTGRLSRKSSRRMIDDDDAYED